MTGRLLTLVPEGRRSLQLYGINSRGAFTQLAQITSWPAAVQTIRAIAAGRQPLIVVVAGSTPYPFHCLSDALYPLVEALVLIPDPWLRQTPARPAKARARRAATLATAHLQQRIEILYGLADEIPF